MLLLVPVLILAVLFYPNVDKNRTWPPLLRWKKPISKHRAKRRLAESSPRLQWECCCSIWWALFFWNAWFMNYSDYIVNEAQLGTTAMAGVIGSLCSIQAPSPVSWWRSGSRLPGNSACLAFILCGVSMLLPQLTQSAIGCHAGGILCQFFNLIVVSGLTTYLGLATTGKNATTAMSLLARY